MLICPKCGRSDREVKFLDAFCVDCYPFNLKIPDEVEIEFCKRCNRMRIKGEWMPYNRKKLERHIASKARGEFESVEYNSEKGEFVFTVRKGDVSVEVKKPFIFDKKVVICPDCSKIAGGYYESIIQLRGNRKKVAKYSKILTKMLKRRTFITKTEEKHGGVDIFAGSTRVVLEAVAELGLRAKITRKLVGTKEGKRAYRATFSIRFE
jgi:nonsense-mediated mRNA decay protein 3